MSRRGAAVMVVAAALGLALGPAGAAAQVCDGCDLEGGPYGDAIPYGWDGDIPFQWDDPGSPPPSAAPYSQGFVLTVPLARRNVPASLTRYADVGTALGNCLAGALGADQTQWNDLTLRVSFRRDGTLNGTPRIPHVAAPSGAEAAARGRTGVMSALSGCTPLPFSPALGQAVAGQIFAIRFLQERKS